MSPVSDAITAEHSREAQELLQRIKNEFLASLNHEIRTPLSGILGMADLLLETRLNEEQKEYVNAARFCAEELLEQLNSALEFSAISTGQLTLDVSDFNLVEALKAAVAQYQLKAQAKGLRLFASLDERLPSLVAGDAVRLRQILSQLIGNAVKFTPRGEVELKATGAPLSGNRFRLQVAVRDTGIGIPSDQFKMIFESFRQGETGLRRRYPGLGLGLAVVQELLRRMDGDIAVQSEPGVGSTLSFSIPLHLSSDLPGAGQPPFPGTPRGRILVVEDNTVSKRIVSHMLLRGHYEVESVESGEAALAAAAHGHYHLILMDLQMPTMDGFETTRAIRRLPGYAQVPVVALTAHTSDEYRSFCIEQGMQGFLSKPVRGEELLETVRKLTAGG